VKRRLLALALAGLAGGAMAAATAPGLTPANYVEIGDTIVDMLDTSGLAFSTLVLGLADGARPRLAAFTPALPVPRAEPFETPCPGGGSVSGSITDRDASGDLSVQDRFVTHFKSCRIDNDVVSGSSEFVVTAHRFDGAAEITELEFRFNALGTDALRWSGRAAVVLRSDAKAGEHYLVSYRDLAVQRGAHAYRWNFSLEMRRPPLGDRTASVDGTMTVERLPLRLAQDDPFVLAADGTPRSGRLTATDVEGDRLQVEAGSRRYRYRFFRHGNRGNSPDSSSQSRVHGAVM